jgi:putative oxygen-independent coproporphyrinogen III oxidase
MQRPGLYVHVPFCRTKCPYCDFYSECAPERVPAYLGALERETRLRQDAHPSYDTLYLGGGTPSSLSPDELATLFMGLRGTFRLEPGAEITLEANPGDLGQPLLDALAALGVNRISVGVQSFDERELRFLRRRHSVRQARAALRRVRHQGFASLGVDLIHGLPLQDWEPWRQNLEAALDFEPEHISCYGLTLEEHTPMGQAAERGDFELPDEATQAELYLRTSELLSQRGYEHYEVSNFALGSAHRSRHNQKYWHGAPYLGLGPAAHSFDGRSRSWNHRSLDDYLAALDAGRLPMQGFETLDAGQLRLEELSLGLRTVEGVSLRVAAQNPDAPALLTRLEAEGRVQLETDRVLPTPRGFLVADAIARMLA